MLNFDCVLKTSKINYTVQNNELLTQDKISAPNVNKLIGIYTTKMMSFFPSWGKAQETLSFDELITDIQYLFNAEKFLKDLKSKNCSFNSHVYSNFCEQIHYLIYSRFLTEINQVLESNHYSFTEKVILNKILWNTNIIDSLEGDYSLISNNLEDIKNYLQQWQSFDHSKYFISNYTPDKKDLFENQIKDYLMQIDIVKNMIDAAGNDLVNWSQHKITRRLNSINVPQSWSRKINYLKDSLIQNGVQIEVKKEKAAPKNAIEAFKRATRQETPAIIAALTEEDLFTLIDSDLKCVAEKIDYHKLPFLERFNSVTTNEKSYSYFIRASKNYLGYVKPNMIYKFIDFMSVDYFKSWLTNNSNETFSITDTLFEKLVSKLNEDLTLNPSVTAAFIKRMTTDQKIKIYDNLNQISVRREELEDLTMDIPWKKLRWILSEKVDVNGTLKHFLTRIAANKDVELAIQFLYTYNNFYDNNSNVKKVINLLTFEQKFKIFSKTSNVNLFNTNEMLNALQIIIEINTKEAIENTSRIISKLEEDSIPQIQSIILKAKSPCLYLNSDCAKVLENNLKAKAHILREGKLVLETSNRYSYYYLRTIPTTVFFKDFTRELVDELNLFNEYYMYLAHCMTGDELIWYCENTPRLFLEQNLDKIPLDYIMQFKDPKKFKELVGNRTLRENKHFGAALLEKLNVTNTVAYLYED